MNRTVEVIVPCANLLGEGATWASRSGRLLWVDIEASELHSLDPAAGTHATVRLPERIGAVVERARGGFLAAFASGIAPVRVSPDFMSAEVSPVHVVETGLPTRLNDGRCDRQGRFVIGSMDESDPRSAIGNVWRLDEVGTPAECIIQGVAISNSICFSPDGDTMYFADTPEKLIWACEYDRSTGRPGRREVLVDLRAGPGAPDGSTVDAAGNVWNAEWGAARCVRYTPEGKIDRVVELPVGQPSCVALGGPALRTLYITTARHDMSEQQVRDEPLSGSLFAVEVDVPGLPETPFAG